MKCQVCCSEVPGWETAGWEAGVILIWRDLPDRTRCRGPLVLFAHWRCSYRRRAKGWYHFAGYEINTPEFANRWHDHMIGKAWWSKEHDDAFRAVLTTLMPSLTLDLSWADIADYHAEMARLV